MKDKGRLSLISTILKLEEMGPRRERLPEKPVPRLRDEKNKHMCQFTPFLSIFFFTSINIVIEDDILVNQGRMCVCVCVCVYVCM